MTVEELLDRMSSRELTEWLTFAKEEPFGCAVDDYRGGLAAAVSLNLNRREGADVVRPFDFYPWRQAAVELPQRDPTPEEVTRDVGRFFEQLGKAANKG